MKLVELLKDQHSEAQKARVAAQREENSVETKLRNAQNELGRLLKLSGFIGADYELTTARDNGIESR